MRSGDSEMRFKLQLPDRGSDRLFICDRRLHVGEVEGEQQWGANNAMGRYCNIADKRLERSLSEIRGWCNIEENDESEVADNSNRGLIKIEIWLCGLEWVFTIITV